MFGHQPAKFGTSWQLSVRIDICLRVFSTGREIKFLFLGTAHCRWHAVIVLLNSGCKSNSKSFRTDSQIRNGDVDRFSDR